MEKGKPKLAIPMEDRNFCVRIVIVVFFFISLAILLAGIIVLFVNLMRFTGQLPEFRVDSLILYHFKVNRNDSVVSLTSEVGLTVRNPNKKYSLHFNDTGGVLLYRDSELVRTAVPRLDQRRRNVASLTVRMGPAVRFVDNHLLGEMEEERENKGIVKLNLTMGTWLHIDGVWSEKYWFVNIACGDLIVGIPANRTWGTLIGGPYQCSVARGRRG